MQKPAASSFRNAVEQLVCQIPEGCVTTYGDVAALAGHAGAARTVGGIAHFGDSTLPWQRVVNAKGGLASGYPGGREAHARDLIAEGVPCSDQRVEVFEERRWRP